MKEQLDSILAQLDASAKIIVADDGSTDKTLDILKEYMGRDSRIQLIPSVGSPLGPTYNLERALQAAYEQSNSCDVVFLSDQDDVWLPGKVQQMTAALQRTVLAIHDAYIDKPKKLSDIRPFVKGFFKNWLKNRYTGCCMAFRRELLEKTLPFPDKLPMYDQWLGMMAEKFFHVTYVATPLINYRQHENNVTRITGSDASLIRKLKWRLDLLRIFRS